MTPGSTTVPATANTTPQSGVANTTPQSGVANTTPQSSVTETEPRPSGSGPATGPAHKPRLATVWLDGCSGCHMSLLDTDERLIALAQLVDVVWGPLVDTKEFPEHVDITLVEGAVSSEDDLERIRLVRSRSKILISLGDCAVTGNVPAMRNKFGANAVLRRAYLENHTLDAQIPRSVIPPLLPSVRPVHELVLVDVFVPGCPPSADLIFSVLSEILQGRISNPSAKFG